MKRSALVNRLRRSCSVVTALICGIAVASSAVAQTALVEHLPTIESAAKHQGKSSMLIRVDERESATPRSLGVSESLYDPTWRTSWRSSEEPSAVEILAELESHALAANPRLRQLRQETAAAQAKVRYIGKLPDPTLGTNVFGDPIETAAGAQRANLTLMQMLPWLDRLDAQAQQAAYEALALRQMYLAEELRVIGDLRANWYRLYVIQKQLEVNRANQQLFKSLTDLANARLQQNLGTAGDVALGTLEISRLQEQLVMLNQQLESTKAELNRLAGKLPDDPVAIARELNMSMPDWNQEVLRQLAWQYQPEIAAAHLQARATRWGVEVARLKRRPDVSLGASWFVIDDNRPDSMVVNVGQDAWSLGAQVSIPLWHEKYDAMRDEATWKHFASHATVESLQQKYAAYLVDFWQQATAASATAALYRDTILPQAEQTLSADQQALKDGAVEFDRVIQDVRNLLTLELGYHRAIGQLAVAIARIEQAVGVELDAALVERGHSKSDRLREE